MWDYADGDTERWLERTAAGWWVINLDRCTRTQRGPYRWKLTACLVWLFGRIT